ncbi:hypothetical protein V1477_014938 [Vespula maculifrons]|uniref:Uncharacterized protein n=1 Tax=Vespula maculifrons TaxID=7453 RepID=A0ABD2BIW0_VESMC
MHPGNWKSSFARIRKYSQGYRSQPNRRIDKLTHFLRGVIRCSASKNYKYSRLLTAQRIIRVSKVPSFGAEPINSQKNSIHTV